MTSIRICILSLIIGLMSLSAAEAADLGLSEIGSWFTKVEKATTSAQIYAFQKKAMVEIQGATIEATFAVTDVKAVTLEGKDTYAVEGASTAPAYGIVFYCDDEDAALMLNKGDTVTMRGTGHGVFFRKGNRLAVAGASLVNSTAELAEVAPAAAE